LLLPSGSANLHIDLTVIVDAFVVVVIGGMGSLPGAYVAAVLIGMLQVFGVLLLPKVTLVLVFLVMALVLAVRPNGLFGQPVAEAAVAGGQGFIGPSPPILGWLGAVALAGAVAAPFLVGAYVLSILTEAAIAVLFAASLHFLMGPGGIASFGHAAWFGIGAYAAALTTKYLAVPLPVALAAAPIAAGVLAACFGAVVVRLSGVYLAMLTLAAAQIVWAIGFQWVDVTGGDNGILGLWPPAALGARGYYWVTLGLCISAGLALRRALYAPFGYALRASRDSVLRAEAIGLPVRRLRLVAVTIAGAAAGLAGGTFTFAKGNVFPGYAGIDRSVDALLMVLLGGVQTISGPVIGALAYTGLYAGLLQLTTSWRFILGAAIVALVLAFPHGIAGAAQGWQRWRRGA
jgi:branched-chain amino acid transport system permease protein